MKRIRRITMEVFQRRQEVSLRADARPPLATDGTSEGKPGTAEATSIDSLRACPLCGAPSLRIPDPIAGTPTVSELQTALASLHLHLVTTPDGRLWISSCRHDCLKENQ